MRVGVAIAILWIGWALSWLAAALWSERPQKRAGFRAEIGYRIALGIGTVLLFVPAHGYHGRLRLWYPGLATAWACVALIAVGIAFCWWARIHLGTLWSGTVTRKPSHHVVDTGPYALVRHPIYSGLLLGIYATMVAKGTLWGIAGAIALTIGVWMKARLEERFLRQELGPAYDRYAVRVPMLVPFMPAGS